VRPVCRVTPLDGATEMMLWMQSVAEVVAAERAKWDGVGNVDAAVFGTDDLTASRPW